ncbi:fatty acid desaturase [Tistlia consotensis]|uniref:fatty acid desaturase n=1 Tax=Tistlia consotensis TaxID=1321365 RepID=UPI000A1518AE|nr:fatty acid desaturase [Tistlia consotensis]
MVEWPTVAVAAAIYLGFGLATWFHDRLPPWLLLPIGAYLVAWHSSLQHEVVHGHPTRLPWLNRLLVLPNLWLWLPYERYRDGHLQHHRDEVLTDPQLDPESYYLPPERWRALPAPLRGLYGLRNCLLGRMVLGPVFAICRFYRGELGQWLGGRFDLPVWLLQVAGVGLVLTWAVAVCGMSLGAYLGFFALPGIALSLVRSFLEHRAVPNVRERTAIVEAAWPWALLFLNNNLHAVHHERPGLPWYRIPAAYRAERARYLTDNGSYLFRGYGEVIARFGLHQKERPLHPGGLIVTPLGDARPVAAAPAEGSETSTSY